MKNRHQNFERDRSPRFGANNSEYASQQGRRNRGFSESNEYDHDRYQSLDQNGAQGWGNQTWDGNQGRSDQKGGVRSDHDPSTDYGSFGRQLDRNQSTEQHRGFFGKGPKGYKRSDERIKEDANQALWRDSEVDASDIEVDCSQGTLTLRGTVPERRMKRAAEAAVEELEGVEDVRNELTVKRADQEVGASAFEDYSGAGSTSTNGSSYRSDNKNETKGYESSKGRGSKNSSDNVM